MKRMTTIFSLLLIFLFVVSAIGCGQKVAQTSLTTAARQIPPTGQIWFGPMMYGQPAAPWQKDYGSRDYLDLFNVNSPWKEAANRVHIFKAYMYAFDKLNSKQLRTIVADLNRRGIAIALETQPLNRTPNCGEAEAFCGAGDASEQTISRIRNFEAVGGQVQFIAMDEPLTCGRLATPEGCSLSLEQIWYRMSKTYTKPRHAASNLL